MPQASPVQPSKGGLLRAARLLLLAGHSQVITEFCKVIGADKKLNQGLVRLAKKNGEDLGFLA